MVRGELRFARMVRSELEFIGVLRMMRNKLELFRIVRNKLELLRTMRVGLKLVLSPSAQWCPFSSVRFLFVSDIVQLLKQMQINHCKLDCIFHTDVMGIMCI